MELFVMIALSVNVLLTAVCAYCLCVAVHRNSSNPDDQFLEQVTHWTRKLIVVGAKVFAVFIAWCIIVLVVAPFVSALRQ